MRVTFPIPINSTTLVESNLRDEALPDWSEAQAFAVGDQVLFEQRVWEALQDSQGLRPPENPEAWLDLGASNSWALFDQKVGTQSRRETPIVVKLRPGIVSDVAVLNVEAESVEIELRENDQLVWSTSRDLRTGEVIADWFDYFFADFRAQTDVIISNVPPYAKGELTITIAKAVNDVAVGEVVMGRSMTLGETQMGASLGINDYSRKDVDAWGNYFVVERAFSKRMSVNVLVRNILVDEIERVLAKYRATPLIWNVADPRFGSLIVYGFYKSFRIVIPYPTHSTCSLDIEGLT